MIASLEKATIEETGKNRICNKKKKVSEEILAPKKEKMKVNWKKMFHVNKGLIPMNVAYFMYAFGKSLFGLVQTKKLKSVHSKQGHFFSKTSKKGLMRDDTRPSKERQDP